jgi:endonuclease/exonuclease/phosphatase family metal-dependent hydrolase
VTAVRSIPGEISGFCRISSSTNFRSTYISNKIEKATPVQTPNQPIFKGTFNGFAKDAEQPGPTIDHIFINKFSVNSCWIDYTTREPGLYISDHYPILLDLQFR